MSANRPLGKIQRLVLADLERHGRWHERCGWLWDTPSHTRALMESLAKRGLIRKIVSTDRLVRFEPLMDSSNDNTITPAELEMLCRQRWPGDEDWPRRLRVAVKVSAHTVRRWRAGTKPIPARIASEIMEYRL